MIHTFNWHGTRNNVSCTVYMHYNMKTYYHNKSKEGAKKKLIKAIV